MNTPSPKDIARIVEFGEAEAYADMFAAALPELGCKIARIGSAVALVAPALPIILFNRVMGLGLNEPATESMLADIARLYAEANVRTYAVTLGSVFQPPALPQWLQSHHLMPHDNWEKVYRKPDTTVAVPTNLRIERIGKDHAADFAHIALAAFEMPPFLAPWLMNLVGREGWQHFVAYDGENPAGTGALYIKNNIGWLGIAGTLPSYRKRGAQGAIMAQRIRAAAEAGCEWVITETGEDLPRRPNPSYHNMLRTGFTLAYQRANYIYQA